jgi:hypothetical protein
MTTAKVQPNQKKSAPARPDFCITEIAGASASTKNPSPTGFLLHRNYRRFSMLNSLAQEKGLFYSLYLWS